MLLDDFCTVSLKYDTDKFCGNLFTDFSILKVLHLNGYILCMAIFLNQAFLWQKSWVSC